MIVGNARRLVQGRTVCVRTTFRYAQRGRFQGRLEITLQDGTQRPFLVIRQLRAVVGNADDYELLKAVAPYVRRRPPPWRHGSTLVEGRRPPALDAVAWVVRLEPSHIPVPLSQALRGGATRKTRNIIRAQHMPAVLSVATHDAHFRILLWIEEHRLK